MPHLRDTTLRLLSGLLVFGFSGGCLLEEPPRQETRSFEPAISGLVVKTGSGDILVEQATDLSQIEVEAVIHGSATELRTEIVGDVLRLDHLCPARSRSCAVDWHVRLPQVAASLDSLTLDTGSGDVALRELNGAVEIRTGSGDIELEAVHGTHFSFDTGSGDIDATACGADSLGGQTGSGSLSLDLDRRPEVVELDTGSGDITLGLPGGRYALDIETGSGDIDVRGLDSDGQAERRVDLSTGSGDVLVHAH